MHLRHFSKSSTIKPKTNRCATGALQAFRYCLRRHIQNCFTEQEVRFKPTSYPEVSASKREIQHQI